MAIKNNLPKNWQIKKLGEVCEHYFSGVWGEDPSNIGNVFIVRVSDVEDDGLINYNNLPLRYVGEEKISKYQLRNGDIVVVKSSGSKKKIISGKAAIFVEHKEKKILASNFVLALRPNQKLVLPKWLLYSLNSDGAKKFVAKIIGITTYPNLKPQKYLEMEIPLPPLSAQHRIVKKIEDLFEKIDKAKKLREETIADTENLFNSALDNIFDEKKKYKIEKLDKITERITKGESPNWQGYKYVEEGIYFIRSENVLWGKLDLSETVKIPEKFHKKLERSQVKKGDVLVNLVGASIGRCASVEDNIVANVNQAVAVVSPLPNLLPRYLMNFIISPSIQKKLFLQQVESARPNISLTNLRELEIPLPPLSEQNRIVKYLDSLQSQVAQLKQLQSETQKELDELKKSILDKAFKGELWIEKAKN